MRGISPFDDALAALEAVARKQEDFVCIGDAEERRNNAAYAARLRAAKKILTTARAWAKSGWTNRAKSRLACSIFDALDLERKAKKEKPCQPSSS